jgi:hypothetical protein
MGIRHRSVILGTLVTHCLQRVGKKCGAGCIAAPWRGWGRYGDIVPKKKGAVRLRQTGARSIAALPGVQRPCALPPDLFPLITIDGIELFLDTPQLGAIPSSELRVRIGSAQDYRSEIQDALDTVFGS